MIADVLQNVKPQDRVELVFKPTVEAHQAFPRLWAMHDGPIFVTAGVRLNIEEELWTGEGCEAWESTLVRTFCFDIRTSFDAERFECELGGHIGAIKIKN